MDIFHLFVDFYPRILFNQFKLNLIKLKFKGLNAMQISACTLIACEFGHQKPGIE
jgi:hypothetical protein